MKNIVLLSLLTIPLLAVNEDGTKYEAPRLAGDSLPIKAKIDTTERADASNLKEAFSKAKIKGLIRYSAQTRNSNLHLTQDAEGTDTSTRKLQQYSTLGGYFGIESAPLLYTSIGATFYTATPIGPNPDDRLGLGGANEDGGTANTYTVLGEAFLKVQDEENRLVLGRQEMPNYRFISLSNIRMSPFTHEGGTYENTFFENFQINLAYINRQKDRNAEVFEDMVRSARVTKSKTRGAINETNFDALSGKYDGADKAMMMSALTYKDSELNLELWDYYVDDFINTVYFYGAYNLQLSKNSDLSFATQIASQNGVGEKVGGAVETWFYGLKAQLSLKQGMTFFTAYNEVAYNEASYDGGTLFVRWGTPQMFNSYQVQDSELAGTKSYGLGAQFELGKMGIINNTVIRFRYAYYDMPDDISQKDAAQDRSEATFDLRYSFTKNDGFGIFTQMDGLSLQFRIAYDDYKTDYDYEAYKAEHGYDFQTVTDDFIDTRLYVDYVF